MKINIAGDFNLENRVGIQIEKKESIFEDEFAKFWLDADFRIANLESPITKSKQPIKKVGRPIKGELDNPLNLRDLGIDYFSLANNHIMDYSVNGLKDTIESLSKAGIGYFGIMKNREKIAYQILEKDDIKVAVCSFSNKEFSLHTDFNGNGALGIDIIEISELLQQLKKEVDHIVLILHTGLSKNPLPSPKQREMCRYFIRQGARAVLCQHSHTIGAYEYYNDGFISYGQGHFAFDLYRENSNWNYGYTVKLNFSQNKVNVNITGHKQFDNNSCINIVNTKEQIAFEEHIEKNNKFLLDDKMFLGQFSNYINKKKKTYFFDLFIPKNRILRKLFHFLPYQEFIQKNSRWYF